MPGFVGAALKHSALQALDSARLALFCRKHGAFMWVYVAVSAGDFYVFLRVTWVTLSKEAKWVGVGEVSRHRGQRYYASTASARWPPDTRAYMH